MYTVSVTGLVAARIGPLPTGMVAVTTGPPAADAALADAEGVAIANANAPIATGTVSWARRWLRTVWRINELIMRILPPAGEYAKSDLERDATHHIPCRPFPPGGNANGSLKVSVTPTQTKARKHDFPYRYGPAISLEIAGVLYLGD